VLGFVQVGVLFCVGVFILGVQIGFSSLCVQVRAFKLGCSGGCVL
jgi:hypothetical protein